jgi:hypothetical protein
MWVLLTFLLYFTLLEPDMSSGFVFIYTAYAFDPQITILETTP